MNEELDKILWDQYLIPGTDTLKNKLGITSNLELKEIEKNITRKMLAKLYLEPVEGNFDVKHILEIHKNIFSSIYPFAGKFRKCSMQKTTMFCNPEEIEKGLEQIFKEMNDEFNKDICSFNEFAFKLAKYYYDIIYIHPFREGNGRTTRVFIRDFVREKSKNMTCGPLDLDYTKIDKNNLLLGTAQRYIYPSMIEMEFMKGLVKVEEKTNKQM